MKAFLGIILNMGLVSLPELKDYWSTDMTTQINFFRDVMPRDRLLQIGLDCGLRARRQLGH